LITFTLGLLSVGLGGSGGGLPLGDREGPLATTGAAGTSLSLDFFSCFTRGPGIGDPGRFFARASLLTPFSFLANFFFFFDLTSVLEALEPRLPFSFTFFTFFLGPVVDESLDDEDDSEEEESVEEEDVVEDEEEERDLPFLPPFRSGSAPSVFDSNCRASSLCKSSLFFSNIISSSCSRLF